MEFRRKPNSATRQRVLGMSTATAIIIMSGLWTSAPARAEDQDWACEVMLCASNPGGWMQFGKCVPPIEKLITSLARGGSFPVCVGGGMAAAKYYRPS